MARRYLLLILALVLTSAPGLASSKYDSRIARLSLIEGHVSFQHPQEVEWSAASVNMALQPADRIYTGEDGRAEIQFDDGSVMRLAEKTDVEILSLTDELIQVRILIGLSTLTVQSSVNFEINTPAAAFNTARKGVYRIDVNENGDTDAIVRKGMLDAANNKFSRRIESGDLLHVTTGAEGTETLSRYDARDEWDEWNDRRNADLLAYESRKYLPDYASVGANDLDRYGRWVSVDDYGPAWVPSSVDSGWAPYGYGRWVYRPFWGWTWVSYEPWGWLPYHYGRWHFSNLGWCWLPGPSFGFHFWSPGLVRFYHGSGWLSWIPLGPGDYYNVNNYFYNPTYSYHVNNLRLIQRRGPDDLANRRAPGAFRTAGIDQFRNGSFGPESRLPAAAGIDRPWVQGRVLTGQPNVEPTSRSFAPLPDRQPVAPSGRPDRPVIVRTEPSIHAGSRTAFSRITNPAIATIPMTRHQENTPVQARGSSSADGASATREDVRRPSSNEGQRVDDSVQRPGMWNRRTQDSLDSRSRESSTRPYNSPSRPAETPSSSPSRHDRTAPQTRQPSVDRPRYEPPSRPVFSPGRPSVSPAPPANRDNRQAPPPRPSEGSRPPAEQQRQRPSELGAASSSYYPRYSSPSFGAHRSAGIEQAPRGNAWTPSQSFSSQGRGGSSGSANGGGYSAPTFRSGGYSAGSAAASSSSTQHAPQGRGSMGSSAVAPRRDR